MSYVCEWCQKEKTNPYGACVSCCRFPSSKELEKLNPVTTLYIYIGDIMIGSINNYKDKAALFIGTKWGVVYEDFEKAIEQIKEKTPKEVHSFIKVTEERKI